MTPLHRKPSQRGLPAFGVGAVLLVLVAIGLYFGFSKHVPFTHGFRVDAVFSDANSIRPGSPVRIAGVNVGKVTGVQRYKDTDASVVELELDDRALPVHKDATLKIRPRIFLEGNFFVDLRPGTPTAPTLGDGDTIPMTQTAAPVQLGDVLTALPRDTRTSLQHLLRGYGAALTRKPDAADDAQAAPEARGETAAQSLNDNFDYAGPAFKGLAEVNQAFLGIQPDDLGGLIAALDKVTGALDRNERQLQDFVSNFNATMKVFADSSGALRTTIRELSPTLQVTDDTLAHLNASFPATRAFAREILPGVRETAATVDASFPWIRQTRALLAPTELQGLARVLRPATRDLASSIDATTQLLPQTDLTAKCFSRVVLPTGDVKISDPPLSTGVENYKEFWYTLVGLAGEGQNFDGNGIWIRFGTSPGSQKVTTGAGSLSGQTFFGRTSLQPLGTRPAYPGHKPPYKPGVPCFTQRLPNLNGAVSGPPDSAQAVQQPPIGSFAASLLPATTPPATTTPTATAASAGRLLGRLSGGTSG